MNHPPLNRPFPAPPSPGDRFVVDVSPSLSHSDSSLSFTVGHARSVRLWVRFVLSASDIIAKPQGLFFSAVPSTQLRCAVPHGHMRNYVEAFSRTARPRDSAPTATVRKHSHHRGTYSERWNGPERVSSFSRREPEQETMIRRDGEREAERNIWHAYIR